MSIRRDLIPSLALLFFLVAHQPVLTEVLPLFLASFFFVGFSQDQALKQEASALPRAHTHIVPLSLSLSLFSLSLSLSLSLFLSLAISLSCARSLAFLFLFPHSLFLTGSHTAHTTTSGTKFSGCFLLSHSFVAAREAPRHFPLAPSLPSALATPTSHGRQQRLLSVFLSLVGFRLCLARIGQYTLTIFLLQHTHSLLSSLFAAFSLSVCV